MIRLGNLIGGRAAVLLALLTVLGAAHARQDPINTGYFGNVAIKGYDPVAYFTERAPVKGSETHALEWLGTQWHFASEAHRAAFEASPLRFVPQYGGHCATGMAISGDLTKDIDPHAWAIIDGKLYLNYSKATNKLLKGKSVSIEQADANWEKIRARNE